MSMPNETKHTMGPWQYAYEGSTVAFIVESDGTTVAKLSVTENSTAHSMFFDNVRLIARAPALLAENETLREQNDKLIQALHLISLGSQNSGTTKEDLGKSARAILAKVQS